MMEETEKITWKGVTVRQYARLSELAKEQIDDEIKELELYGHMLEVVTGRPAQEFFDLELPDFRRACEQLSFLKEEVRPEHAGESVFVLGGRRYKMTPSVHKMTSGQYIDYTTMLEKFPHDTAKILSTILVPQGKKYQDGYDIEEVERDVNDKMSIVDALGIAVFFSLAFSHLSESTLRSTLRTLKKELKKETDQNRREHMLSSIIAINRQIETIVRDRERNFLRSGNGF